MNYDGVEILDSADTEKGTQDKGTDQHLKKKPFIKQTVEITVQPCHQNTDNQGVSTVQNRK